MENVTPDSSATDEEKSEDSEVLCLMRVGKNSEWIRLYDNTEVQFANAELADEVQAIFLI